MTILHARLFSPTHCRLSLKSAGLAATVPQKYIDMYPEVQDLERRNMSAMIQPLTRVLSFADALSPSLLIAVDESSAVVLHPPLPLV